jgi:hypothetical protein
LHPTGQLTHTKRSDGTPETDGVLQTVDRGKILHSRREPSVLANELPEGSDQCRFLRAACLTNLKESVGLILSKTSVMRISIPFDFSSRSFMPLPCFIRSRRPIPLLAPSLLA